MNVIGVFFLIFFLKRLEIFKTIKWWVIYKVQHIIIQISVGHDVVLLVGKAGHRTRKALNNGNGQGDPTEERRIKSHECSILY